MRALILGHASPTDGIGRLLRGLGGALRRQDVDVSLVLRQMPQGVKAKVPWMLKQLISNAKEVRRQDAIVVHSPLSVLLPELIVARASRRRVIGFVWDIYPESTAAAGGLNNPVIRWLYAATERLSYRLCHTLLVPSDDYQKFLPAGVRHLAVVFPLWPTEISAATSDRAVHVDQELRIVFAGQINSIRALPAAVTTILATLKIQNIELVICSHDPMPIELERLAELDNRLSLTHLGLLDSSQLSREFHRADFGLVSLDQGFGLPAFPSKILSYAAARLPVLYVGPRALTAVPEFLRRNGLGIEVASWSTDAVNAVLRNYSDNVSRFLASEVDRVEGFVGFLSSPE